MLGQQKFTYLIPGFLKGLPSVFNHTVGLQFYSLSPCLLFARKAKEQLQFCNSSCILVCIAVCVIIHTAKSRVQQKGWSWLFIFSWVLKFLGTAIKRCCRPQADSFYCWYKKMSEIICGVPGFYPFNQQYCAFPYRNGVIIRISIHSTHSVLLHIYVLFSLWLLVLFAKGTVP